MAELAVRDLTVEYRSGGEVTRPLDGFEMVAPPGSLARLLGPSGSGKTTLLSCLAAILLERVSVSHRATHRPGELPGGQQQRVAIACAPALDPPLMLADEPTAHLDHTQVEGVLALLAGLVDGERVMVIATHDDRVLSLGGQRVDLGKR